VDLTLSGETLAERQTLDPVLTPEGLRVRVPDYVGGADAFDPHISPIFGDLSGLPPLLIQVGSHEILLSDALRLAERAALSDVPVTLEVTPASRTSSKVLRASSMRQEQRSTGHQTL
jgi:epsilon-lactone hydrolase